MVGAPIRHGPWIADLPTGFRAVLTYLVERQPSRPKSAPILTAFFPISTFPDSFSPQKSARPQVAEYFGRDFSDISVARLEKRRSFGNIPEYLYFGGVFSDISGDIGFSTVLFSISP
ncbi:MAG: hypothetical protein JWM68_3055 [Verrucomicrobiales bacterium]|nr:hypothetical protein [Verrucomicrobiales bacterium]